jgi:4-amino-4-deoxy-L-arabinose transferase-like glycosyltransferase
MTSMRKYKILFVSALLALLVVALGLPFIRYAGAHYDETIFVSAIYSPAQTEYAMKFSFARVPIMVLSYMGTLKAALMAPAFRFAGASLGTLRVPMLLGCALSVVLFFLAMRRITGTKPALLASMLLGTDAVYILTSVFDWGPVVLQHLLFAASFYSAVRFSESKRRRWLFLCGLFAGLALWDKALFLWLLAGFGIALPLVYAGEVRDILRDRKLVAMGILGAVLGALPLLYYNKVRPLNTLRANVGQSDPNPFRKVVTLDATLDGRGLFGYLVRESPEGQVKDLKQAERYSLRLSSLLGDPRKSLQHLLLVVALLSLPWLCFGPHRRLALTVTLAGLIAWLLMLRSPATGGALHHTVLLWPLPQLIAALAAAQVIRTFERRGALVCAGVFLLASLSNIAVLNTYLAHFIACGPSATWSDAVTHLVQELGTYRNRHVFAADWGILRQVQFYGRGTVSIVENSDGVLNAIQDDPARNFLENSLSDPDTVFVTHTEGKEAFPDSRKKLLAFAEERGYRHELKRSIHDRHGAAVFEIHEFRK